MATQVTGDQYFEISGQLHEIDRQLRQKGGYPYNLDLLRKHLQAAIEGVFLQVSFKIWRTSMVGGLINSELLAKLAKARINVSDWARTIMNNTAFVTSLEAHEVGFVRAMVKELDLTQAPTTPELIARVKELGGQLCQPEDGPWLALHELKLGDQFRTIMEPITDSDGYPLGMFYVGRYDNGSQWLRTCFSGPDDYWSLNKQIVFRAGK